MDANPQSAHMLGHILGEFDQCADLVFRSFPEIRTDIVYFPSIVDQKQLTDKILAPFAQVQLDEVEQLFQQSQFTRVTESETVVAGILAGNVAIFQEENVYLLNVYGPETRGVQQSETESIIAGPHDAFVESAITNISLIRQRIKSSHLKILEYSVGEITKTSVYVLYIKDIANMKYVEELEKRIKRIEIDAINDGGMLTQFLEDRPNSVFPQFLTTERPDVAVSKLVAGRIITLIDNSPTALAAPSAFFEFFSSPDDYYQRWALGTALRLLRYLALVITISFTAFYVSVTTFHYEMIPEALLIAEQSAFSTGLRGAAYGNHDRTAA